MNAYFAKQYLSITPLKQGYRIVIKAFQKHISCICCGFLLFCAVILLAGFVKEPRPYEFRRALQKTMRLDAKNILVQSSSNNTAPALRLRLRTDMPRSTLPTITQHTPFIDLTSKQYPVASVHSALWEYLEPHDILPRPTVQQSDRILVEAEAVDENGYLLRWTAQAPRCTLNPSEYHELTEQLTQWEARQEQYSRSMRGQASRYRHAVEVWSRRFSIRPELICAIMYVESSFRPHLVSSRNAHGLMQVVPTTAGDEVRQWLGEAQLPSAKKLFDPYENIKYGTGYMRMLLSRHFNGVNNTTTREYCAIAAYNSGSTPVLRVFGKTREQAIATINTLTPNQVLNSLLKNLPARETRNYLRKVLNSQQYFVALL